MALQSLNHVTIRPHDIEATRNFYVEIVGLTEGARPPFGFPGY
jgi:catechol 2,3-dioxygenase-like lactoylglutathione lyase family enzyme